MWPMFYEKVYEPLFYPIRDNDLTLLELGWGEWDPVRKDHSNPDNGGRSARAWSDFFPNAQILSIDIAPKNFLDAESYPNVELYDETDQTDPIALNKIHDRHGDFDIVIDDASHVSSKTIGSFKIIWPWVKPGGLYIIEDLHSSYHSYYFGQEEANENPAVGHLVPTAMGFFTRLAHEPFYNGKRMKGPAVDGDPCSWDCYPKKYSLGYDIELITFAAPQIIVIRKKTV